MSPSPGRGNRGGGCCRLLSRVHLEGFTGDLRPAALAQYPSPAFLPELVQLLRAQHNGLAQCGGNRVHRSFLNDQTTVRSLQQGAQPSGSGSNDRPSIGQRYRCDAAIRKELRVREEKTMATGKQFRKLFVGNETIDQADRLRASTNQLLAAVPVVPLVSVKNGSGDREAYRDFVPIQLLNCLNGKVSALILAQRSAPA